MFRKLLGYTAFAIGGVAAFKLTAFIFGLVLSIVFKIGMLALIAFAIYTAVGFFYPGIFGDLNDDNVADEEIEVAEEEVEDTDKPE